MSHQPELPFIDPEREILGLIARMCAINGHKVVADALGVSESHLSHALARRKNAAVRIEKTWKLVQLEGGRELLEFLAQCRGDHLVRDVPPEPREVLTATWQVLREQLGPMVRKDLKRAVDQRVRDNRDVKEGEGD